MDAHPKKKVVSLVKRDPLRLACIFFIKVDIINEQVG